MGHILTECRDGVLRIGFDRAEKKNAITVAMYRALAEALDAAAADGAVRVVLFHGKPGIFTSGNDLSDFLANPPRDENAPTFRFLRVLSHFDKPLVAAVSGAAIGIGTTMLLHCDLVYAAPGTQFVLPFVNLALVPEAASSFLLARLAGWARAAELLLLGEPFGADKAKEIGLINEIVAPGELLDTALASARKLAAKPPAALRLTKSLMKQGMIAAVEQAMAREARAFGERLNSPEAKEAFSAFLEKRKPDFTRFS
ncbi:MAG: enoyl-CoA hydratase [Burkholderiales bacterium]